MLTIKNLPFLNVVGSGVASLELPVGMTYNKLIFKMSGTTFARTHITRVVCKLNGKIFYDIDATRLQLINSYKEGASDTAYFVIDFTEKEAKTVGGMQAGGIGTATGVTSFIIEITIAGATAPVLESWSMISEPMPLTLITGLLHHTATFSAAGTFPIVLPHGRESEHLIKRVFFFHSLLTEVLVKKNGVVIYDALDEDTAAFISKDFQKTPAANMFVVDYIGNNNMKETLDISTAQSMQYDITVSGADTINVYSEILGTLTTI